MSQVKVYNFTGLPLEAGSRFVKKADYDRLRAQLERVVKFYGCRTNWDCGNELEFLVIDEDSEGLEYEVEGVKVMDYYGGKLARQVAKEEGIEI